MIEERNNSNFKKNIRLMNKNTEVVRFNGEIINKIFQDTTVVPCLQAENIHVTNKEKCPIFLSDDAVPQEKQLAWFNSWLQRRCVSGKRKDIPSNLKYYKSGNKEFNFPHLFSLYDQYWLKFNETEKWENLNFFSNDYSTDFGKSCFSINKTLLEKSDKDIYYNAETPDITTGGIVPKAWKQIDGENYLFKYQLTDKSQTPLNEIIASRFLSRLNIIDFVNYEYGIYEYHICSKCLCFVDSSHEFIPMIDIYNLYFYRQHHAQENTTEQTANSNIYDVITKIIKDYNIRNGISFINKMIIADTMLMNDDRHLGNFGVLRNVETGKIEKFAPLFDFGSAFFPDDKQDKQKKQLFSEEKVQQAFTGYFKEHLTKGLYDDLVEDINNGYFFALDSKKKENLKGNILIQNAKIKNFIKNGEKARNKAKINIKDTSISYGAFENL